MKPRNIPHTFWNVGPAPARLIEIITPSKFEHFFHELGGLAATTGPDEFPVRFEVARRVTNFVRSTCEPPRRKSIGAVHTFKGV